MQRRRPSWRVVSDRLRHSWRLLKLATSAVILFWIGYATTAELIWMFTKVPLPTSPITTLEPFRIANQYGLFAVMTRGRYEIEFQGSADGQNWVAYPFRYKPQALNEPPRIYAPYQPRFDWNLWFASLGSWREYPIVPNTEVRLLENDKDVLGAFCGQSFRRNSAPPDSRIDLAILVHDDGRKTRNRKLVEETTPGLIRAHARADAGGPDSRGGLADGAAPGLTHDHAFTYRKKTRR